MSELADVPRPVPAAAPGPLRLVQQFLNTLDVEQGTDALATARGAAQWLRSAGFGGARLDAGAVDRLRAVRSALRAACGDVRAPDADHVDLSTVTLRPRFDEDGSVALEPAGDAGSTVIGRLLLVTHAAQLDGTWSRLKICRKHDCRWAFYDRSRSRSAMWCAMGICGNRTKVAAYRQRIADTDRLK